MIFSMTTAKLDVIMIHFAWIIVLKQDSVASMIAHVKSIVSLVVLAWTITIGVQSIPSTVIVLSTGIHNLTTAPMTAISHVSTVSKTVMPIMVTMDAMKLAKISKIVVWEIVSVTKTVPTDATCLHSTRPAHHGMPIVPQLNPLLPQKFLPPLKEQLWLLPQHCHQVEKSVHQVHQLKHQKEIWFWSFLMIKQCCTTGQREAKNTFSNFKDHTKISIQNSTSTVSSDFTIFTILFIRVK